MIHNFWFLRFYLEEPPGTQKLYLGRTAPPSKVMRLGDKEQSNWIKEVQGISEQWVSLEGFTLIKLEFFIYPFFDLFPFNLAL